MHFVEGVLEDAHLPHVLGSVGLVKHELDAELVLLALDTEVFLVVDQVGDLVPLEELRLLPVPLANADTDEAGGQQDFLPAIVLDEDAVLSVAVQLLSSDNVVNL